MTEQKECKLWNGQNGMTIWEWPDGEERGAGLQMNPNATLTKWFECPVCGEFVSIHDLGMRSDSYGKLYCRKCSDDLIKVNAVALDSEENFRPITVEVPTEFMIADIMLLPSSKQGIFRDWPMKRPLLGVFGINGSGKTMALYAVYKNLARRGRKGYVMICGEERRRWSQAKDRDAICERWAKTPWLLIDDFTSPAATDGWQSAMHDLLTERLSNRRPTLVTMHSQSAEVREKFGEGICSRFSSFQWVSLPPVDWRKRQRGVEEEEKREQTLFDDKLEVNDKEPSKGKAEPLRAVNIVRLPTAGGKS